MKINIPKKISKKKGNEYLVKGNDVIVFVHDVKREKIKGTFIVDLSVWEQLKDYYWNIKPSFRIYECYVHNPTVGYLHKIILGNIKDKEVDHINGNRMDNRIYNLRLCNHKENTRNLALKINNTSGKAGVVWNKSRKKWAARIKINYKDKFLGHFNEKEDAIRCRIKAENKYFGEFSPNRSRNGRL